MLRWSRVRSWAQTGGNYFQGQWTSIAIREGLDLITQVESWRLVVSEADLRPGRTRRARVPRDQSR